MLKRPVVGTYHTLISEVLVYASLKKSLGKYLRAIDKVISGVKADLGILEESNGSAKGKGESIPQRITWSAVNRVYGYCDVVICPSEAIKRELEKRGVKRRIEVVSNGVDLVMFKSKKDYRSSLRVVHAGRLGFEKNVDVVIKAFARVAGQLPKAELVIAGDGPATGELKDLSRKLGIEKRVKFLGMIKREKLAGIYQSGDVFATASTMETQGMVVLEAMACGLPIIGVRKYALPDLVHEGENGFVVRPGNEKQMAAKMAELLSNPVLAKRMGIKSIEFVQKHEVGIMAKRLEGLYMRAMADKAAGGE
jgi:glycosyltransferase involved in cell wall biosynthesis